MVAKRTYRIGDPNIFGYGRPNWGTQETSSDEGNDNDAPATETPQKPVETAHWYSVELPLLMIGDTGPYVRAAQALLIARGYDCGNKPLIGCEKPDGEFGPATQRAVGFLQAAKDLDCDGEIGGQTWAALLKFD
jgi:peptidoglycan hydrolase-like protein with peptidoglycan-binding domain